MTPEPAPLAAVPLWFDLLAVRAELAATGDLAAPYARRHSIDLAGIEVCAGVPVLAALRYGADRSFDPGGRTLVYADDMAAREAWGRFMTGYAPRPEDTTGRRPA